MNSFSNFDRPHCGEARKLSVKIFTGTPEVVEESLTNFFGSRPINVLKVLQSESSVSNSDAYIITVTVFYKTSDHAQFLSKPYVINAFHEEFMKYIEEVYGISFCELWDLCEESINRSSCAHESSANKEKKT